MSDILLRVVDLRKVYSDKKKRVKEALRGVSFEIFEKEIFSLLGVNGAGKTTLSSIIASLHPPTSGDIIWRGRSIYEDLMSYRRILGFCPQHQNLDMDLNLEQNLRFVGRYYGLSKAEIKRRKDLLIEKFQFQEYVKSQLSTLSGGYRQRFMIARTIMHDPLFVILDEPTVGLDARLRRQLWKYILELKEEGRAVMLTTHYLEEADILSDRVCVIDGGEIKVVDSPKRLKEAWKKKNLEDVFLHLLKQRDEDENKPT